jgi:hypothetical protein
MMDELDSIRRNVATLLWAALDASSEKPSCDVAYSREKIAQAAANILISANAIEEGPVSP